MQNLKYTTGTDDNNINMCIATYADTYYVY